MAVSRSTRPHFEPFAPRNLWLAGLGLAAVTRREAGAAAGATLSAARATAQRLAALAVDARDIARGGARTLCERAGSIAADLDARLAPVLGRAGTTPAARRTPRKPPARRAAPPRRRSAR